MMCMNPNLPSQELVGPQGGALEREQKVATAGQCPLAVSPVPGPRMLLVSAMAILLLLLLCSGGIPILMLGSSHSCFVSEGVNYIPGRPGRS